MIKKLLLLFTAAGMILCVLPFAGLAVSGFTEPVGNEQKTAEPSALNGDNSFNPLYFQQLGAYFEKSFAFRPQMITADAAVQSTLFQTSNLNSVVTGTDGWLYYSSSLDDFLGRNLMSQRAVNNAARNLRLTQDYVKANGAEFIFTVAPNKNSLYPGHMPYYCGAKASSQKNSDRLKSALDAEGVNYCDLFELFGNESETLYLKQDSHWNNKGALLAYNKILDALKQKHNTFGDVSPKREKTHAGDLAKMIYPSGENTEYNFSYGIENSYKYTTPTKSVEDAVIITENQKRGGSLYMFRDSFGNALLPFFAGNFGKAEFTKALPVNVSLEMTVQKPDTVIFEIVERNINRFAENPPVIPANEVPQISGEVTENRAEINAQVSEVNMMYVELSGKIPQEYLGDSGEIYVRTDDKDGNKKTYEAFGVSTRETDCGFLAYIPLDVLNDNPEVSVLCVNGGTTTEFQSQRVTVKNAETE